MDYQQQQQQEQTKCPQIVRIVGPQGIQGIQGITGPTGPRGIRGEDSLTSFSNFASMSVYNINVTPPSYVDFITPQYAEEQVNGTTITPNLAEGTMTLEGGNVYFISFSIQSNAPFLSNNAIAYPMLINASIVGLPPIPPISGGDSLVGQWQQAGCMSHTWVYTPPTDVTIKYEVSARGSSGGTFMRYRGAFFTIIQLN